MPLNRHPLIASEGTPTGYGGRTVRLDYAPAPVERAERRDWKADEDAELLRGRRWGLSYKIIARWLSRTPASVMARHIWLKREGRA